MRLKRIVLLFVALGLIVVVSLIFGDVERPSSEEKAANAEIRRDFNLVIHAWNGHWMAARTNVWSLADRISHAPEVRRLELGELLTKTAMSLPMEKYRHNQYALGVKDGLVWRGLNLMSCQSGGMERKWNMMLDWFERLSQERSRISAMIQRGKFSAADADDVREVKGYVDFITSILENERRVLLDGRGSEIEMRTLPAEVRCQMMERLKEVLTVSGTRHSKRPADE